MRLPIKLSYLTPLLIFSAGAAQAQTPDPPSRLARLNYLSGQVSFRPGAVDDWAAATLNYPLTTGDHLWTDPGAQTEMHVGSTAIRMGSQTALAFLNLDDRIVQPSLTDGSLDVHIRSMRPDEVYEVDTPNAAAITASTWIVTATPARRSSTRARPMSPAPMHAAIVPERASVLGGPVRTVAPPARSVNARVVTKSAPAPARVSFAAQQRALEASGGRPLAPAAHNDRPSTAARTEETHSARAEEEHRGETQRNEKRPNKKSTKR